MALVAVRIVAPAAPFRLWIAACACSVLPDADSFSDLDYDHAFGHRGFFHSLLFAAIAAGAAAACVRGERPLRVFLLLFAVGASHGLLDAMTDGGLGIVFFAPFDDTRYFLPWRPIAVSPIGIRPFFSEWGVRVIRSEFIWVWLPLLGLLLVARAIQSGRHRIR